MSQEPRLLACFLLPVLSMNLRCFTRTDDIARSSHIQKQAPQVTWISDPKHRLLSLATRSSDLCFVISTRIFFEPDFVGSAVKVPWKSWGPSNTRVFPHEFSCRLGVSGSRALCAFAAADAGVNDNLTATEYRIHLMDFSPLAVKRHYQHGLGRIVNTPSTVENIQTEEYITTSMPYVEVVSDRTFSYGEFVELWLDRDKLYLLNEQFDIVGSPHLLMKCDVLNCLSRIKWINLKWSSFKSKHRMIQLLIDRWPSSCLGTINTLWNLAAVLPLALPCFPTGSTTNSNSWEANIIILDYADCSRWCKYTTYGS